MDENNYKVSDEEMANLAEALNDMLDDEPDFYGMLKECAWNILHENPGTEFGEWQQMLIEQFPTEVVDALGSNPSEVYPALSDLWDSNDYEDPDTGICETFQGWAEYFATERSVVLLDELTAARREIARLRGIINDVKGILK